MKKLVIFVLIIFGSFTPIAVAGKPAAKPPLIVVFGRTTAEEGAPVSLEITAAVIEQLNRSGQVQLATFNPGLPSLARAVLEKRLSSQALDQPWEPKNAVRVAQVMRCDYALCVTGATDDKVTIHLELLKVPSGGDWKTNAESQIAAGPRSGTVRSNAISTAASSAVSQILIEAFGDAQPLMPSKPAVIPPAPAITPTTAPTAEVKPAEAPKPSAQTPSTPSRDVTAEYNSAMAQAQVYLTKKDMRNAALELRHAINLDPLTPTARLKLADVYSDLGMADDAIDECKRAVLFAKDSMPVYSTLVRLYLAAGRTADAADQSRELIRLDPTNIEAQIALGDILWNQGKVDEAAGTYYAALKIDPNNAGAHARLQRLFSARKMYSDALQHLLAMKVPSAAEEPDASKRYEALAEVIQDEFAAVVDKIESAQKDYDQTRIAREDYYQDCKDGAARIDALANYLTTQTAPAKYKDANPHGVLAVSLLAQASGYLVTYLETEKQNYRDQAFLLENDAKSEMTLFAKSMNKG